MLDSFTSTANRLMLSLSRILPDSTSKQRAADFVRAAYWGLLERQPDAEGFATWIAYLESGHAPEDLLRLMVQSEEFRLAQGHCAEMPAGATPLRELVPKISIFANCQGGTLRRCIQALTGSVPPQYSFCTPGLIDGLSGGEDSIVKIIEQSDVLLVQPATLELLDKYRLSRKKVKLFPSISFPAFFPDMVSVYEKDSQKTLHGVTGVYHSAIGFFAWKRGMSVKEARDLFRDEVFRQLRYYDGWEASTQVLLEEGQRAEFPLEGFLASWRMRGCFMHTMNHPKLFVIADLAYQLLKVLDIPTLPREVLNYVHDDLADMSAWSVYPPVARQIGMEGSYLFRSIRPGPSVHLPIEAFSLDDFLIRSFEIYSRYSREQLFCDREESHLYKKVFDYSGEEICVPVAKYDVTPKILASGGNPYSGLASKHFWRQSVANVAINDIDPVVQAKFHFDIHSAIATAGSCFAQHISQRLQKAGFSFLRSEVAPSTLTEAEANYRNYGVYSARFGNIYTTRQLRQLVDRAYNDFQPADRSWKRADGKFIDPFRPEIEPDGFDSIEVLEAARVEHLSAVRHMFESLDLFVFTLGLTEAWRAKADGSVFPLAPGIIAGTMDFDRYEFVNFTATEVIADLNWLLIRLKTINPKARLILTVSPVPLIATFEDQHVLSSTTYSKSVLRVAADEIARSNQNAAYFPAYEIITGNFNRGTYYDADLRSVTPAGVDHVMRLFFLHYAGGAADKPAIDPSLIMEAERVNRIVCEEERMDRTAS